MRPAGVIAIALRPRGVITVATCLLPGAESDAGPPSPRARRRCQEHPRLVREGAQDQGDLPHSEHVQPGRDAEVPHQRVLVPGQRPREDTDGTPSRNRTYT